MHRLRIVDLVVVVAGLCSTAAVAWTATERSGEFRARDSWTVGQSVKTTSGTINGQGASNNTDVSEYLGIPYAQAPTGTLRWQAPVAYSGSGTIDATDFGSSCIQGRKVLLTNRLGSKASIFTNPNTSQASIVEDYLGTQLPESEDCLTLNIWTKPQVGDAAKAVLVWIHGGAYISGGTSEAWYNGQYLAEEQDVVVVSVNYRLNIFGFPGNPTSPSNLGIQDQRMAVEWIRDNIANFAGDPDRIVLFGQSAGGSSVDMHAYAYADDPIVSGIIPESGNVFSYVIQSADTAANLWYETSSNLNCGDSNSPRASVLTCMLGKAAMEIIEAMPSKGLGGGNGLPFGPMIDDTLVFSDYSSRVPASLPILVGNTDDEAGLFQWILPTASLLPDSFWTTMNEQTFTCSSAMRASMNVLNGNPTWRYRWFGVFPNLILPVNPTPGAWHGSELPSIFNTTEENNPVPNTDAQNAIGLYLRGAWAAFAKDTAGGLDGYDGGWPKFSTGGESLIRLGYGNQTGVNAEEGNSYDSPCSGVPTVTTGPTVTGTTTAVPSSHNAAAGRLGPGGGGGSARYYGGLALAVFWLAFHGFA
ncbi:Alpha/Beta hydrolase protein [Xylariales sp. PMI_506]|nr:Alpha/Beta hydrolase protein [Xylariales sp. PMI_506]